MAVKKTGRMVFCPICNVEKPSNEFYESENPHDGCTKDKNGNVINIGYVHICKNDIAKCYLEYLKKGTMQSAVYFTCALTDTPFIKEVWDRYIELRNEKIKSGKITPTQLKTYNDFAKYREQLKSMKKATDNWNDFSDTNIDYTTIMGLKKSDASLEAEKDKFVLDWGKRDNLEDYQYLEYEYDRLTKDKALKPQEETLYRKLCMVELMIRLKEEKDEATNTEQTQMLNLMKTLKIDNFSEDKDLSLVERMLESQIATIEKEKPCFYYEDLKKNSDYMGMGQYWNDHVLRPLKNLLVGSKEYKINQDMSKFEKDFLKENKGD